MNRKNRSTITTTTTATTRHSRRFNNNKATKWVCTRRVSVTLTVTALLLSLLLLELLVGFVSSPKWTTVLLLESKLDNNILKSDNGNNSTTTTTSTNTVQPPSSPSNNNNKLQQQLIHELPLEQLYALTSQDLTPQNISRNLCGAIPNSSAPFQASPSTTTTDGHHHYEFPQILSTDDETSSSSFCRPNAIIYLVQKGKHASYNRNSKNLFTKSLDLLYQNYLSIDDHSNNTDVLLFHTGDYNQRDLRFLQKRYHHHKVHFKLINLNHTIYWTMPRHLQQDNISAWHVYPAFSMGYRHMMRWYTLTLYDFIRDYAQTIRGCNYKYLLRMDEDSFIHSPISYDLFDFMQSNHYSYAFRLCTFEMKTDLWTDYMDHINYCGLSSLLSSDNSNNIPYRTVQDDLCGFYNNFFLVEVDFFLQPHVQHFLRWVDALGIIYRDWYGDLRIQSMAVYAFMPPHRIHRFLDWTYEHLTTSKLCPIWGALQAGYLDRNASVHFQRLMQQFQLDKRKCRVRRDPMTYQHVSPSYSHLPPPSWWNDVLGIPLEQFKWQSYSAGFTELPHRGNMSG